MVSNVFNALSFAVASGLFVDEIMHGLVAVPFSLFLYHKTKSVKYSIVPLLVVYLIDMDHWVDYFLYFGLDINLTRFLSGEYFIATSRAVVPLHAWEWLIGISAIAYYKKSWASIYTGVALGMLAHLIWDSHTVSSVAFYSIIYRALKGFVYLS